MTDSPSSIASERKGHRRGLVLGFTMAETFLLLVFCLLLVAAAVISGERQLRNRAVVARDAALAALNMASQRASDLADQNKLLSENNERLQQTVANAPKPGEDWRELRLARDAIDQLSGQGLSTEDILALGPSMGSSPKRVGKAAFGVCMGSDWLGSSLS